SERNIPSRAKLPQRRFKMHKVSFLRVGAFLALENAERLPVQYTCTVWQSSPVREIVVKLLTTHPKQPMPRRLPLTAHAMITIITAVHNSASKPEIWLGISSPAWSSAKS